MKIREGRTTWVANNEVSLTRNNIARSSLLALEAVRIDNLISSQSRKYARPLRHSRLERKVIEDADVVDCARVYQSPIPAQTAQPSAVYTNRRWEIAPQMKQYGGSVS